MNEIVPVEEWRIVEGYADYEVSTLGRVRRATNSSPRGRLSPNKSSLTGRGCLKAGYILKPRLDKNGYQSIGFYPSGQKQKRFRVARLVAHAFLGPCPQGKTVNHIDGIKSNDCVTNLEYITPKEQYVHATQTGLYSHPMGESWHSARLTEVAVAEIRALAASGEAHRIIAERFRVSRETVSRIVRRASWRHVA